MNISETISNLEKIKEKHGDLPCLIEVIIEGVCVLMPVDELSVENRVSYGKSVTFLM